jgi:phosphatidate cytidylyltransferase
VSGTRTRLISGVIAFLAVLPILLFGGFVGVFALAAGAAAICCHEYVSMALPDRPRGTMALMMFLGAGFFCVSAWSTSDVLDESLGAFLPASMLLVVLLVVSAVVSSIWFMLSATHTEGLADRWARFMLGLVYVPGVLGLLPALLLLEGGQGWLWVPLFIAWCGDIGGYFAGRAFGDRKLFPLISPKKTWAGFVGGLALSAVGLLVFKYVFYDPLINGPNPVSSPFGLLDCALLGCFGYAAAVLGDGVESMLKRSFGVKDSGTIMPGHGGLLDRIDGVQFALVVVYLWAAVLRPVLL